MWLPCLYDGNPCFWKSSLYIEKIAQKNSLWIIVKLQICFADFVNEQKYIFVALIYFNDSTYVKS